MRCRVDLTENAVDDLLAIVEFIARDNEQRANAFVQQLRERIEKKLSAFPESGTEIGSYRFTVFAGYVVVYAFDEPAEQVRIVLVTEGHRNWRRALEERP